MSYKPLVYVAHPCSGLIRKNRKECRQIIKVLTKNLGEKYVFISPILNFGHMYYDVDYICGIETCIDLLQRCNILLLTGDWKNSKGCLCEYGAARAMQMPVSELKNYCFSDYIVGLNFMEINALHPGAHGQKFETKREPSELSNQLTVAN
jgi:hypothetical protein